MPTPMPVRVYVLGAVARPGVYPLAPASRLEDALAAAGGPSLQADLSGLNLAQAVADGDRVNVPEKTATPSPAPPTATPAPTFTLGPGTPSPTAAPTASPAPATAPAADGKLDLNTATAAQLEALPRIGPATAARIIDYRNQHGPFRAVDDLLRVKGIGPATLKALREYLIVP